MVGPGGSFFFSSSKASPSSFPPRLNLWSPFLSPPGLHPVTARSQATLLEQHRPQQAGAGVLAQLKLHTVFSDGSEHQELKVGLLATSLEVDHTLLWLFAWWYCASQAQSTCTLAAWRYKLVWELVWTLFWCSDFVTSVSLFLTF